MYDEDELLPISALQHLAFCERQWALIHIESIWEDNPLTVQGRQLHQHTDEPRTEVRGDVRIAHGLRLRSLRIGLSGRADVVEFHLLLKSDMASEGRRRNLGAVRLPDIHGLWKPIPIEYKRGHPKINRCDEVQLCAQVLCLEEMLDVTIPSGMLFYGEPRRRYNVIIDDALRYETETLVVRLHELTREAKTPPAKYEKRCRSCSLFDLCLPKATGRRSSTIHYLLEAFRDAEGDAEGDAV